MQLQAADGSWSDANLINQMAQNSKEIHQLRSTIKTEILITKLVMLWMQKHHPQKQYALIIKKALAWLRKACT